MKHGTCLGIPVGMSGTIHSIVYQDVAKKGEEWKIKASSSHVVAKFDL